MPKRNASRGAQTPLPFSKQEKRRRYTIDRARANRILSALFEEWQLRRGVFAGDIAISPQKRYRPLSPKTGEPLAYDSLDYAVWALLLMVHMRSGNTSTAAFQSHVRLYAERPELYDLATVARMERAALVDILRTPGLGLSYAAEENAKNWIHNADVVLRRFGGDPRRIWENARHFRTVKARTIGRELARNDQLWGMQEKVLTLYLVIFQELGVLAEYLEDQPMPVDVHLLRFFLSQRIVRVQQEHFRCGEWLMKPLRALSVRFAREHGISISDAAHALWVHGSENCFRSPAHRDANPTIEEFRKIMRRRPDTSSQWRNVERYGRKFASIRPETPLIQLPEPEVALRDSICIRCPVFRTCELAMNTSPYTLAAMVITKRRRPLTDTELWLHAQHRAAIEGASAPNTPAHPAEQRQSLLFAHE